MKTIILASGSPRRQQLLQKIISDFVIEPSHYKEDMTLNLPPFELAKKLSLGKAQDVASRHTNAIVIGADTFVVYHNQVLGKPHTATKAVEMLILLNGGQHLVITGYTIIDTDTQQTISQSIETKVYFKNVTPQQIDAYVATREPLEMAGAYALQQNGRFLLDHYEGDYDNILGLPLTHLAQTLKQFNL